MPEKTVASRREKVFVFGFFICLMSILIIEGSSFLDALIKALALLTAVYRARPYIKAPHVKIPKIGSTFTFRLTEKVFVVSLIVSNRHFEWQRSRCSFFPKNPIEHLFPLSFHAFEFAVLKSGPDTILFFTPFGTHLYPLFSFEHFFFA